MLLSSYFFFTVQNQHNWAELRHVGNAERQLYHLSYFGVLFSILDLALFATYYWNAVQHLNMSNKMTHHSWCSTEGWVPLPLPCIAVAGAVALELCSSSSDVWVIITRAQTDLDSCQGVCLLLLLSLTQWYWQHSVAMWEESEHYPCSKFSEKGCFTDISDTVHAPWTLRTEIMNYCEKCHEILQLKTVHAPWTLRQQIVNYCEMCHEILQLKLYQGVCGVAGGLTSFIPRYFDKNVDSPWNSDTPVNSYCDHWKINLEAKSWRWVATK